MSKAMLAETQASVQLMAAYVSVGQAAMAYHHAALERKQARRRYVELRNEWLTDNDYGRSMKDALETPDFFEVTDDAYRAFVDARRIERNALRRLESQCRRAGGDS